MITRKYNLINNIGGWLVFIIALVTYWLTLEPTASYWDCGEFIIQADKLEVGHPPGNPIFMLTARFFANFAPNQEAVSVMVNAMSGLLSALTILLLFWTISHLVRRLVVKDGQTKELSLQQYVVIMGSALVGSLAYAWSDTFWFSAVEGEVYAFSSFCTALVFWLILKWENRADEPHSDRYLILIAYIIGVSVAVHLLNLLCIPAIVLVFAYRKWKNMNLLKSVIALLISFAIIVLVLYGLVPGFIKVAQVFELVCVNDMGMSFNSGAIIYAIVMAGAFAWALTALARQKSAGEIIASFTLASLLSGIFFFGSGVWIGILLTAALLAWLLFGCKEGLPVRVLNVTMWSMAVIFIGYSSYTLILIRSSADTPMNQNAPDNVFDLASYLNREQYGENPLIYGQTLYSSPQRYFDGSQPYSLGEYEGQEYFVNHPVYNPNVQPGKAQWHKGVKDAVPRSEYDFLTDSDKANYMAVSRNGRDFYAKTDYKPEVKMNPELDMLFPRLYSRLHADAYKNWVRLDTIDNLVEIYAIDRATGEKVPELNINADPIPTATGDFSYPVRTVFKPTFGQNLSYFFNYQLNHMYMRYFMWNFAGRQNDINNQNGELDAGNWISGIPFIDNPRLGDQSYLPDPLGKDNKGHNVYYMLPLLLGIIGLLWQAFAGNRGIEQFWVVFFFFFMTGIAIVIYLNQTPLQPRERDYAFAGSFYAFAIWIGMGVAGLWRILMWFVRKKRSGKEVKTTEPHEEEIQLSAITDEPRHLGNASRICAIAAAVLGLIIPLQMVSQTWDDHDRSGRYTMRDFASNYLQSLEPDAIVFCNGDNDTFPLWYAQEVEGIRPDVKIINLSYLSSDWYANQALMQSYDAKPVKMTATPKDFAYNLHDVTIVRSDESAPINLLDAIKKVYANNGIDKYTYVTFDSRNVYIPVDKKAVLARGLVAPEDSAKIVDRIEIDLMQPSVTSKGYISLGELLMLDIIATNAANGWERPVYWAATVGDEYHLGLTPYVRSVGMVDQLVPTKNVDKATRTDRAYDVVTGKYRWGGLDLPAGSRFPYLDETSARMLSATRSSMLSTASQLMIEGEAFADAGNDAKAAENYRKALKVVNLLESKLPRAARPYELQLGPDIARIYCLLGEPQRLNDKKLTQRGLGIYRELIQRYAAYVRYQQMMAMEFGPYASFTFETQLVPYRFYALVEDFEKYGGKRSEIEKYLKGLDIEGLKNNSRDFDASLSMPSYDDTYLMQFVAMARVVAELQGLSPEEYAKTDEEWRFYDSIFYQFILNPGELGLSTEQLLDLEEVKKLDLERSKRLLEEYKRKNPDKLR